MKVSHWNQYTGEGEPCPHTHSIVAHDWLASLGQVRATVNTLADPSGMQGPDVLVEINNRLGHEEALPCFHIAFNSDSQACSLFKLPDGTFLLRLETGVELVAADAPGEFILKGR